MIRHLGYACINMTLSEDLPISRRVLTSRTIRQASFSLPKVNDIIVKNCEDLLTILKWNNDHSIKLFRISSEIFPFIDHPDYVYQIEQLNDSERILSLLRQCGDFAKQNGIRLTSHPGPYNCLGSPNDFTVKKTLLSVEMHRLLGELLGLQDFIINLHVGGSYGGDFHQTSERFCTNFGLLSDKAKQWLTLENDDKPNMWSVPKLYNYIHQKIGIPIIFDIHHWQFCNEYPAIDEAACALSTWHGAVPKFHYSESADGKRKQAHSDYINNVIPDYFQDVTYDVMLECKMKEKALLKYRDEKAVIY